VVAVVGARQTGKTTLVRRIPEGSPRLFRSLDDPHVLEQAPEALLQEGARLALDEVQRRPELLLAIKRDVDRRRAPGRFLITGSANLLLMARVGESLAGRAVYLTLRPLTEPEKRGAPVAGAWDRLMAARDARAAMALLDGPAPGAWDWTRAVIQGGFPIPARTRTAADRRAWFEGYVQTYVERDLRQLAQVDALVDFRRLMRVAALRVGRIVNQADMARDAGLAHATAHRYLNLLEASCLIHRLPVYAVSRTKRLIKMPKLYWADTGLAAHLAEVEDVRRHECGGGLLENLVLHHLLCWAGVSRVRPQVMYWRTAPGEEVDFVVETGRRLLPIEVKSATRVGARDVRHLSVFLDEYGARAPFGIVVYPGDELRLVAPRIVAAPLAAALGVPAGGRPR
jgi:predicted AAA+ superfamily ATPase